MAGQGFESSATATASHPPVIRSWDLQCHKETGNDRTTRSGGSPVAPQLSVTGSAAHRRQSASGRPRSRQPRLRLSSSRWASPSGRHNEATGRNPEPVPGGGALLFSGSRFRRWWRPACMPDLACKLLPRAAPACSPFVFEIEYLAERKGDDAVGQCAAQSGSRSVGMVSSATQAATRSGIGISPVPGAGYRSATIR